MLKQNRIDLTGEISPLQITTDEDNYNPTDLDETTLLRIAATFADLSITGIQGGSAGRVLYIYNRGSIAITLPSQDAGSTAANRFNATEDVVLEPDQKVAFMYDGVDSRWQFVGVIIPVPSLIPKSINIESPTSSEDITMFFTDRAITISEMEAVLANGVSTPSVTWTIRHATDRSAAGAEVVTGGTVTTSVTTGSIVTSFNDATIPANSWVWLETTAQSGTVPEINVTLQFNED